MEIAPVDDARKPSIAFCEATGDMCIGGETGSLGSPWYLTHVDSDMQPVHASPLFSLRSARLYVAIALLVYTFAIALARTVLAAAVVCMIAERSTDANATTAWNKTESSTTADTGQCALSVEEKDAYGVRILIKQ